MNTYMALFSEGLPLSPGWIQILTWHLHYGPPPPQPSGVNTYMALFGEGLPHLCLCLTHLHPVPGHWTPPIWGRAPPGQDHWAQVGVRGVGSPRHLSGHICFQKHLIVNIYTSHLQFQKKIIHSIFHKSAVYLNQCLKLMGICNSFRIKNSKTFLIKQIKIIKGRTKANWLL